MWPIKDEFISNGLAASNMHYRACQRQKTCPWKDLELSHLVLSFHLALQTMSIIYQYLSSITITIVLVIIPCIVRCLILCLCPPDRALIVSFYGPQDKPGLRQLREI